MYMNLIHAEEVQMHLERPDARGCTIKTSKTTVDIRGPKDGFWSIHVYRDGRLVQTSETRTEAVMEKVNFLLANDGEVPEVYRYF